MPQLKIGLIREFNMLESSVKAGSPGSHGEEDARMHGNHLRANEMGKVILTIVGHGRG